MHIYCVHIMVNLGGGEETEIVAEVRVHDRIEAREIAFDSPWVVSGKKPREMGGYVIKVEHKQDVSVPGLIKWHNHPLGSLK